MPSRHFRPIDDSNPEASAAWVALENEYRAKAGRALIKSIVPLVVEKPAPEPEPSTLSELQADADKGSDVALAEAKAAKAQHKPGTQGRK
jgi:hypothetical protein